MIRQIGQFLNPNRPIGRVMYFVSGVILFGLKYVIDCDCSLLFFDKNWIVYYYTPRGQSDLFNSATPLYLVSMAAISLPFAIAGVLLTLRRLRALAWSPWVAILFFAPFLNVLLIITLLVVPNSEGSPPTSPIEVRSTRKRQVAIALTACGFGFAVTLLSIYGLHSYGGGLFIGMPFCLGMIAGVAGAANRRSSFGLCVGLALSAAFILGLALLLLGLEGAICLMMAAPIVLVCAFFGVMVGYFIQRQARWGVNPNALLLALVFVFPPFLAAEKFATPKPPLCVVRTAVIVNQPPEVVWKNVLSFPDLPPPQDCVFSTGVAYPTSATISGFGPGAIRRCEFSTGAFVEPIEVWDEPKLLKFSVTQNPPPMREWSIWKDIHPPHLDGFMTARAGQFLLEPLDGGRTRLEGTTWYQQDLWPNGYWQLWTDFIIHRIHSEVLEHVKHLSEGAEETGRR